MVQYGIAGRNGLESLSTLCRGMDFVSYSEALKIFRSSTPPAIANEPDDVRILHPEYGLAAQLMTLSNDMPGLQLERDTWDLIQQLYA